MKGASIQRIVTLALAVLDRAAYASRTHKVDSLEVRLALAVLWCVLRDREGLKAYWTSAGNVSGHPWDTCRLPYYQIVKACRDGSWDAPV
jgi:4-amino-4-deoxy-L-arabinose transferase-like glycosyltransferase